MNGRDIRVVVAMTTWNAEGFVRDQLESLLAQSLPPSAIVISDDGSTDATCEIIESIARRSPIAIHLIRNERQAGVIENSERVYARAVEIADVIVPADDDDMATPEKIEAVYRAFRFSPDLAVWFSDGELISVEGESLGPSLWEFVGLDQPARMELAAGGGVRRLLHAATISGGSAAFRADVVQAALPLPRVRAGGLPLFYPDAWLAVLGRTLGDIRSDDRRMLMYRRYPGQESDPATLPIGEVDDRSRALRLHAARVSLVAQRIRSLPQAAWNQGRTAQIASLDLFLQARLLPRGAHRAKSLVRHLLSGDYVRYARGVKTFIGDVIFPPLPETPNREGVRR